MKLRFMPDFAALMLMLFVLGCSPENKEKPKPLSDSAATKIGKHHHPDKNVFMWEVRSANSKAYILGSIHVAKSDVYPLDPRIENAFTESTDFVSEADMSKANLSFLAEKAMFTDGTTLKKSLPNGIYKQLSEGLEKHGLNDAIYSKLKPGFALLTFLGLELKAAGFLTEQGIDLYFANKAKEHKKEIHELESIEFQVDLFDKGLNKYMNEFMEYSLSDIKNLSQKIDSLFYSWSTGDTAAIAKLLLEGQGKGKNMDNILKMFIDDRNVNMAARIEEYLKTGRVFFVVAGAAHMIGDRGIISLLNKKEIYKIKQL